MRLVVNVHVSRALLGNTSVVTANVYQTLDVVMES